MRRPAWYCGTHRVTSSFLFFLFVLFNQKGLLMSDPKYSYPSPEQAPDTNAAAPVQETMPTRLRMVRVLLFVIAGLSILVGVFVGLMAHSFAVQASAAGLTTNMIYAEAVAAVVLGVVELVLGLRFKDGGNAVRVTTLVWGVLAVIGGLAQLPQGVVDIVIGGLVVAQMRHPETKAWFERPRGSWALRAGSVNPFERQEEK
ncbi:hypothetical protein NGB36_16870 [Streptomyces sp. RB6PN25]|uniref:Integral membrane protein n=1 Tax=Streptomyces humicola TaxID=2953240 RepID=A0ABT1PX16_9ACTN|nr:hypothetical protein [Streptomyces humicola]MCQ4082233.1 hypothetical protein [Streptomyces humicola]